MSKGFTPVIAGSALGNTVAAPVSPKNIPNRGGEMNPSVDALRRQFSNAVRRADVVWGCDPLTMQAFVDCNPARRGRVG